MPGNNAAEKWTEGTVLPILENIWDKLTEGSEDVGGNVVRANDMKLATEVRLMFGVTKQRWKEWKDKFTTEGTEHFSDTVSDLIKKIEEVLEARLIYSGQTMDIFVLKNHYDYADKTQTDLTTKGKAIEQPQPIMFLSAKDLTDEQIENYLSKKNAGANDEGI